MQAVIYSEHGKTEVLDILDRVIVLLYMEVDVLMDSRLFRAFSLDHKPERIPIDFEAVFGFPPLIVRQGKGLIEVGPVSPSANDFIELAILYPAREEEFLSKGLAIEQAVYIGSKS